MQRTIVDYFYSRGADNRWTTVWWFNAHGGDGNGDGVCDQGVWLWGNDFGNCPILPPLATSWDVSRGGQTYRQSLDCIFKRNNCPVTFTPTFTPPPLPPTAAPTATPVPTFTATPTRTSTPTRDYKVTHIASNDIIRIDFTLGFRVAPKINLMFRKVVQGMVKNGEVDITSRYESLNKNNVIGDFKFVVLEKFLSYENELPTFEKIVMTIYFFLKKFSLSEAKAFGLDSSSVKIEKFPMVIKQPKELPLNRIG